MRLETLEYHEGGFLANIDGWSWRFLESLYVFLRNSRHVWVFEIIFCWGPYFRSRHAVICKTTHCLYNV